MKTLAMLSMHTSPLAQPGEGDGGGMNVFVRELAGALAQAGVGVRVYVRRTDDEVDDRVSIEPGFEVVHVDVGPLGAPKESLADLVDPFADAVRDDIAASGDVSLLHANYWLSGVAGHRIKHELSIPLASTFHTLGRVKTLGGDPESMARIEAETAVIGCSDLVTAATPVEARQLIDLYGAPEERIELVPPGVDLAFFSPGDRDGARWATKIGSGPIVLFVGRIQALKGLDVAVEALSQLKNPDARLVVVGGPSGAEGLAELERVGALVARLNLGHRISWVPPKPHHLLSSYYRSADVVVVPSRSESFGLVALEAAACGVPVVAADVGGLSSLVIDGVTGILVPGRDSSAYANAIDDLLADTDHAAALGAAAAAHARAFTWSTTAARLRRCYADLSVRSLVTCA